MTVKTAKIELEVCDVNKRNSFIESVGKHINSTFKSQYILTLKEDKKDIYDDLLKLQKSNFRLHNFIVNKYQNFINSDDKKFKLENNEKNEINHLATKYSKKLCEEYQLNNINSTIPNGILNLIDKNVKKTIKDIKNGKRVWQSYREQVPIPLSQNYAIVKINGKHFTKIDEMNKNYYIVFWGILFKTNLGRDKSNNASIIEKTISGEYKFCDSNVVVEKNKIFLLLSYDVPQKEIELDEDKVLGIDLGIKIPAVGCIYSKTLGKPITYQHNGKDVIESFDETYVKSKYVNKYEKKEINPSILTIRNAIKLEHEKRKKDAKYICTNGHGRNRKMKFADNISNKEKNTAKLYYHNLSRDIINFALKNKCKQINIENLKGFKGDKVLVNGWGYFTLQNQIEYKANEYGIKVKKINPKNTSRTCSSCGHVSEKNRMDQEHFKCEHCGLEMNADYNASINIAKSENFVK
jgi:IS605 OrfB family transposase